MLIRATWTYIFRLMETEMGQEASVPLSTIIEQSPQNHAIQIHPLARSGRRGKRDNNSWIDLYKACITYNCKAAEEIFGKEPSLNGYEVVEIMVAKHKALLSMPDWEGMMPLCKAALSGRYDVVKYLFDKSNGLRDDGWDAKNRAWLLQKCVEGEMFDIALQIVKDHKELACDGEVLRILAKKPDAFVEKSSNIIRKTVNWVFAFICPKEGHPQKDTEALQLLRIIWKDIVKKPKKAIDDMIRGPADVIKKEDRLPYGKEEQQVHLLKLIADHVIKIPAELQKINGGTSANISITPSMTNAKKTYSLRTLFIAAEMGNTKFIVELIRQYPDLIWKVNDNNQTIFHIAVK
ncbi:ankyrin repeat-containing domain, PGG domain protein, partial [Tanacetum coccineum]